MLYLCLWLGAASVDVYFLLRHVIHAAVISRLSFNRFGDPAQVLELRQMSRPLLRPDSGYCRCARPDQPSDLIPIHGQYAHRRTALPQVPGYKAWAAVSVNPQNGYSTGRRALAVAGTGSLANARHAAWKIG